MHLILLCSEIKKYLSIFRVIFILSLQLSVKYSNLTLLKNSYKKVETCKKKKKKVGGV
jgi:hypothetical protein